MGVPREPIHPSHLPWRRGHHLPQGRRRGRERRRSPRTRSRQTKLRRGPGSPFCLVEQGYGVCGARDERAHAGQQQQLVDQLGNDVLLGAAITCDRSFGSTRDRPWVRQGGARFTCHERERSICTMVLTGYRMEWRCRGSRSGHTPKSTVCYAVTQSTRRPSNIARALPKMRSKMGRSRSSIASDSLPLCTVPPTTISA
jgi:hypothetical protein